MLPLVLLGPLAMLAGKAIEALLKEDEITWQVQSHHYRIGPAGQGLTLAFTFSGNDAQQLAGGVVVVRPKSGGQYVKSKHPEWADSDGDLVSGAHIVEEAGQLTTLVYLPFCAFPDPNATLDFEFTPVRSDQRELARQQFEGFKLEASKFRRRNALAAICDGAIGAVRLDGLVDSIHIRTAKDALKAGWNLDAHGLRELQQHLKYATGTDINGPWYDPERIATDICDDVSQEGRVQVLHVLYAIAGAKGGVGGKADALLTQISQRLQIDASAIEQVRALYCVDVHYTVLGIGPNATVDEIKSAFRAIAKICHPDATASLSASDKAEAAERFRTAKNAYDVLMARA